MQDLLGKVVGIVGNGPSATGRGSEIDACDFVIRQNAWVTEAALNAGNKVSALVGFFGEKNKAHPAHMTGSPGVEVPPWLAERRDWELWSHIPGECFRAAPTREAVGDWKWLLNTADGRAIRMFRLAPFNRLFDYLHAHNPSAKYPSLGLTCIGMVVDLNPSAVHLWGYDSVGYGYPGYDLAQKQNQRDAKEFHNYVTEKQLIAELVDKKTWCGKPVNFDTTWHHRPNIPGVFQ